MGYLNEAIGFTGHEDPQPRERHEIVILPFLEASWAQTGFRSEMGSQPFYNRFKQKLAAWCGGLHMNVTCIRMERE